MLHNQTVCLYGLSEAVRAPYSSLLLEDTLKGLMYTIGLYFMEIV